MKYERSHGRVGHKSMRFYHAMFQLFIFAMLLALLTNNVGVLWISMELATLSTVLLVSLYRTPSAIEAAWKYFILCGVGIALALFGTVLLYFASEKVFGEGSQGLLWTNFKRLCRPARADRPFSRLHIPDGRLRHQGRARPASQLAAGRAQRGADAHIGRPLGPAAQCRALRAGEVQGNSRRSDRTATRAGTS